MLPTLLLLILSRLIHAINAHGQELEFANNFTPRSRTDTAPDSYVYVF